MKKVFGILRGICCIGLFLTAGMVEADSISFGRAMIQIISLTFFAFVFGKILGMLDFK